MNGDGTSFAQDAQKFHGSDLRVLLADDNVMNQRVAIAMLARCGCRVEIACTGIEAVERFQTGRYDLILMDCQMPGLDGMGAARAIRALESSAAYRTPIVAITAHVGESEKLRCLAAGMDDFLSKPVSLSRLRALLETVRARMALHADGSATESTPIIAPVGSGTSI